MKVCNLGTNIQKSILAGLQSGQGLHRQPKPFFHIVRFEKNQNNNQLCKTKLQGSSKDGPDPFCLKTINVLLKLTLFLAGPHIQTIQISCQLCSNVDIKNYWAHQILQRAHKNFKWPVKIWKIACI